MGFEVSILCHTKLSQSASDSPTKQTTPMADAPEERRLLESRAEILQRLCDLLPFSVPVPCGQVAGLIKRQ